jgi:hypothetical protein
MKQKHTHKRSANRKQNHGYLRNGMSRWLQQMLFGGKEFSKTTQRRGGKNSYPVFEYVGQRIGKERNSHRESKQRFVEPSNA